MPTLSVLKLNGLFIEYINYIDKKDKDKREKNTYCWLNYLISGSID